MSGPLPIRRVLEEALERLGMGETRRLVEIQGAWEEMGDERWVEEGKPVSLRDGELVIEVLDGGAASLLRYAAGRIRARLDDRFGAGTVRSVRVVVARRGSH